jgi:hypothetical protein
LINHIKNGDIRKELKVHNTDKIKQSTWIAITEKCLLKQILQYAKTKKDLGKDGIEYLKLGQVLLPIP